MVAVSGLSRLHAQVASPARSNPPVESETIRLERVEVEADGRGFDPTGLGSHA